MVIAGDTPDGPLHAECKDGKYKTELLTKFHKQLDRTRHTYRMRDALEEMQNRVSTNPVDKIAGLALLMQTRWIPAYYESASLEEAWTALVDSMKEYRRAELFVLCPEPGNRGPKWRPSWEQAMTKPVLPYQIDYDLDQGIDWDETVDVDWCDGWCIEGFVQGLAVVSEGGNRYGEFIVRCHDGSIERFKITTAHTYPIPEDTYTLIYFNSWSLPNACVIGRSLPGGKFEKVSVLETSDTRSMLISKTRRYILV
ncbi:hypothetical protein IW261DRAFT_1490041 [Armillaria novae-zelandiae]|uniref:Uncharacterized protein n=1 Tax=Armillaria novae-zelandiae TaxID=153914 RepID=A0AA39P3B4_9AGAR|nr:hypothetical protein IW261DRAFT_1490041 [Armillaria novae-zelandiae]